MNIYVFSLLITVGLTAPVTMSSLPAQMQMKLSSLPFSAQKIAVDQMKSMGSYDENHTRLGNTGRFFFVENPASSSPKIIMNRRTISDNSPSGFVNGIPIFHSLPGSQNVIYLDFLGENITGRAWNSEYGIPVIMALPYNPDGIDGFSASEQTSMSNIWRRVAEDYIAWDVGCNNGTSCSIYN